MKIYLVKRKEFGGYDTYNGFVCAAGSPEEAIRMHPNEAYTFVEGRFIDEDDDYITDTWISGGEEFSELEVFEIGEADKSITEKCVIFTAFDAG